MKKFVLLTIALVFISTSVFAGKVIDSNNGNKGDIFISTGENNGTKSVGEWIDSDYLKGQDGADVGDDLYVEKI